MWYTATSSFLTTDPSSASQGQSSHFQPLHLLPPTLGWPCSSWLGPVGTHTSFVPWPLFPEESAPRWSLHRPWSGLDNSEVWRPWKHHDVNWDGGRRAKFPGKLFTHHSSHQGRNSKQGFFTEGSPGQGPLLPGLREILLYTIDIVYIVYLYTTVYYRYTIDIDTTEGDTGSPDEENWFKLRSCEDLSSHVNLNWRGTKLKKWRGTKKPLMKVKEESEKVGLKLNIQKTKIMASGPITSWQIDGETVETVSDFILWGSKITTDSDCSHEMLKDAYSLEGKLWPT